MVKLQNYLSVMVILINAPSKVALLVNAPIETYFSSGINGLKGINPF